MGSTDADAIAEEVPRIRGVPILSFLGALRTLAGYDAVNRMLGSLPADLREAIRYRTITGDRWYPIAWYRALHAAAQSATGMGRVLARMIGRETTRADFSGVNRVFLFVLSPQALLAKAPRVYEQYFMMGTVRTPEIRRGHGRVRFEGCSGFDRNVWDDMIGSVEVLIELSGGRDVRVEIVSGGGDEDVDTEMTLTWK
jgi:hypothetical protein